MHTHLGRAHLPRPHVFGPPVFALRPHLPRHSLSLRAAKERASLGVKAQQQDWTKHKRRKSLKQSTKHPASCRACTRLAAQSANAVQTDSASVETNGENEGFFAAQARQAAAGRPAGSTNGQSQTASASSSSEDIDLDSIIAGASFDQPTASNQDWYSQLDKQEGAAEQSAAEPDDGPLQEQAEDTDEVDPDASYPDRPQRSYALEELMELAGIGLPEDFEEEDRQAAITGLQNRAEKVKPGDLFMHNPKPEQDVWGEVKVALQQGAAAIMSSELFEADDDLEAPVLLVPDCLQAQQQLGAAFYDRPSLKMNTVAVTGSAGKTTTSWLIRGIFDELDRSAGLIGTVEYGIDEFLMTEDGDLWKRDEPDPTLTRESSVPDCLTPYCGKYEVPETLPDGLHLQKIMAGQCERGATDCVIECTAEGLQEGRCNEVDIDVAVFTNILKDKVEEFGGIEAYLQAQGALFSKLQDPERQRVVVNIDDPYADQIVAAAGEVLTVTYGLTSTAADVRTRKVIYGIWESEIDVITPIGDLKIITTLIGQNNVYNVLAAVATGLSMNIPLKDIVAGIEATEVVPGRTEYIDLNQNFQVLVDSASTPDALLRLLNDVWRCAPRNILLVMGCEGDRDPTKRPYMGEIAYHKSSTLFITNQNQRSEAPEKIVRDIVAGFPDDILDRNAGKPWKGGFLQDARRVSATVRPFLFEGQNWYRKYVVEDRYTAIRWAIATAQQRDIVIVAGKGDQDWTEVSDGDGGYIRGWLDDRVECRNALSKLYMLTGIKNLDRTEIPFENVGEREGRWWEWGS